MVKIGTRVSDSLGNRLDAKVKSGAQPVKRSFRV